MNEMINGGALAVTLTCDQLHGMIREAVMDALASVGGGRGKSSIPAIEPQTEHYDSNEYAYGLHGICDLFNVSKKTAIEYKKTWLAPAVKQRGRQIVVHRKTALELFDARNKEDNQ